MWPFKKTIKNYPSSLQSANAGLLAFSDVMENYQIPGTDEAVEIRKFGYRGMTEKIEIFFVPPEKGRVAIEEWGTWLDAGIAEFENNLAELLAKAAESIESLRHEGEFFGEFKAEASADVRELTRVRHLRAVHGEGYFLTCDVFVCEGRTIPVEVSFSLGFEFLRAEIVDGGYIF